MGIGDWGLGIGDWGLGIGPNPQSPIPITVFKTYLTEFNYQDNSITFYNTKSLKPSINIQILLLQILLTIQIINMLYLFMFYKVRLN